jgi:hypothetical protein
MTHEGPLRGGRLHERITLADYTELQRATRFEQKATKETKAKEGDGVPYQNISPKRQRDFYSRYGLMSFKSIGASETYFGSSGAVCKG